MIYLFIYFTVIFLTIKNRKYENRNGKRGKTFPDDVTRSPKSTPDSRMRTGLDHERGGREGAGLSEGREGAGEGRSIQGSRR